MSIPLILKAVPRNHFYGFRTPRTLSNDSLWYRANHFAGWAILIAAIVSAAILVFHIDDSLPTVFFGVVVLVLPLLVALAACFIYLRQIDG